MKKWLILSSLLISLPVFSACPLDENTTACSIAEFREIKPTYARTSSVQEYSDTPETRLQPTENEAMKVRPRNFGPKNTDFSYNSTCQFGICKQGGVDYLFNRGRDSLGEGK